MKWKYSAISTSVQQVLKDVALVYCLSARAGIIEVCSCHKTSLWARMFPGLFAPLLSRRWSSSIIPLVVVFSFLIFFSQFWWGPEIGTLHGNSIRRYDSIPWASISHFGRIKKLSFTFSREYLRRGNVNIYSSVCPSVQNDWNSDAPKQILAGIKSRNSTQIWTCFSLN